MLLKGRTESDELLAMRYLKKRIELPEKEKTHYSNLEKGYSGEVKFDSLCENLHEKRYFLNDLLLKVNSSYFQIDTLLIAPEATYIFDIKNYEGDYYIEGDKLIAVKTGREYNNPVIQLTRCSTLLRQLLQNLKINCLVEASVIFINPKFTLYQAPMNQPITLPTQVNRLLNRLTKNPSKLNEHHKKLAYKLLSLHQSKNPYAKSPEYQYEQLQKGIYCSHCSSYLISKQNYYFVCGNCGEREKFEQAILRNVEEFKLLFPNRKITTQSIHEWCKTDLNKKTIRRILKLHYTVSGKTSDTYYK